MSDIPRGVLSEKLEQSLDGRRLLAAVFVTFRFEPEFFEQQVLPIFVGGQTSHVEAIRLVQMEDMLRQVPNRIAVYYDSNGLDPSGGSAKLDVARIPIVYPTGIFHPKNIFALVEKSEPDKEGYKARTLVAACLSANLTRAGWWENIEVCHIEEIEEGETTRLRADLLAFLTRLEQLSRGKVPEGQPSVKACKDFLRSTEQRLVRSSSGRLHPHFFDGKTSVVDFLAEKSGGALTGLYLEVISPYFDVGPTSKPLEDLIEAFAPKEVRVYLPKNDAGEALCSAEIVNWVSSQPNVTWAKLSKDLTRSSRSDEAKSRVVHAKVYRFFRASPKREYLFVGSVNLTQPAHRRGGNLETGFLINVESPRRPEWWMEPENRKPVAFAPKAEDEGAANTAGSRLSIRYQWDSKAAFAFWDSATPSPALELKRNGVSLCPIGSLPPREWKVLDGRSTTLLERELKTSSLFQVAGERDDLLPMLIQEEGMAQRPSLLMDLSPTEILRYWTLLSDAQRTAFLEEHSPDLALTGAGSELISRYQRIVDDQSFFDRFAGIFIAYGQLEQSVRVALQGDNSSAAVYRLFGQKYDSLGTLLTRVASDHEASKGDLIDHYLVALCARQVVRELERDFPDFFREHREAARQLQHMLSLSDRLKSAITVSAEANMTDFLAWFEDWFVRRAKLLEEPAA